MGLTGSHGSTGRTETRLVIVRGPSGSGKSTVARVARHALDTGYSVVVEGILYEPRYGDSVTDANAARWARLAARSWAGYVADRSDDT